MIKGLCNVGKMVEANEMMNIMKENGCSPHEGTYSTIVRGHLKNKDILKAIEFVEEMRENNFSADASTIELVANLLTNDELDPPSKKLLKQYFLSL
jgi:pentatricopeptide repeat protein